MKIESLRYIIQVTSSNDIEVDLKRGGLETIFLGLSACYCAMRICNPHVTSVYPTKNKTRNSGKVANAPIIHPQ